MMSFTEQGRRRAQELARQQESRRAEHGLRQHGQNRVFPPVIISTNDKELLVRAEVPGMKLEEFEITVSGDVLTVEGVRATGEDLEGGWYHRRERPMGRFSRAVHLPAEIDGDRAEAAYVAGILTVALPLRQAARPTQVPIR
ncbi:MAG: Hsp20/alpha crystallin family protein, partial [Anaerolineae bacterium]